MKALIFIGLAILTIAHPTIGIVAILLYFMIVGIASSFSGGGSNRLDRNIVYRHEVVVRETIYEAPNYLSREQVEQLHAQARARAAQAQAHVPAHQQYRPQSTWEMQDKLVRVNFSQLN
jgi:hypothetical protein